MFYPTVSDSFFGDFNSVLNSLVKPTKIRRYSTVNSQVQPRANISRDDTGYQVSLAAPGLSRSDFNIEVSDNVLTVSSENKVKNEKSLREEYSYSKFSRSWALPETADIESITAEYQAGILNVNIPVEDVIINKTKKIEVK
tara:strand:+ start:1410 stop:1832 length:423 start_codon:yes stop_codon:yes gene_type:complete